MKIRRDHEYSHDLGAVYALFTDAAEVEAKQAALGARHVRIEECELYEDGADVRFIRELPADVPRVLARFLQPWNTILQSEQWRSSDNGGFDAELDIEIENVPVSITGSLELEPTDRGCVNHVRVDVDCGIPLVGGTLAEYVAKDCERLIADEYQYICERLGSA
jgi:hypothetical protein